MLRGAFESAGELTADELRAEYDELLRNTIENVGPGAVTEETDLDRAVLDAFQNGESPDILLTDAAAILATDDSRPDPESIEAEARDILLMGMTTAVLDVEAVASGVNDELDPKEIQQKIEGRFPMSLDEYALLHAFIEGRKR